ncbi:MAG: DUF2877 domain-containing protein [Telmatospirillum sp.]|nr:DUF2877 domain-containing protein [Telmatospirillum sp.]
MIPSNTSVFVSGRPDSWASRTAFRPLAVSATAHALLSAGGAMVRFGHRRGATVMVPGCDLPLYLSGPGNGLLPLHIVMRRADLDHILTLFETDGAFRIIFDLDGVRLFRTVMPGPASMAAGREGAWDGEAVLRDIEAMARWLSACSLSTGLGSPLASLLAPKDGVSAPDRAVVMEPLLHPTACRLRRLIGRGAGSTPAGDDILVGALAIARAFQGPASPLTLALKSLEPLLSNLTTRAGAGYLRMALAGEFSSHLIALVRELGRGRTDRGLTRAARVAAHGASSGRDTLVGVVTMVRSCLAEAPGVRGGV